MYLWFRSAVLWRMASWPRSTWQPEAVLGSLFDFPAKEMTQKESEKFPVGLQFTGHNIRAKSAERAASYCAKCEARLKEVKVAARKTLMAEVKLMGRCHPEAFGGVQLERMFTEGFLRGTRVDNFTPVQRRRLESILQ